MTIKKYFLAVAITFFSFSIFASQSVDVTYTCSAFNITENKDNVINIASRGVVPIKYLVPFAKKSDDGFITIQAQEYTESLDCVGNCPTIHHYIRLDANNGELEQMIKKSAYYQESGFEISIYFTQEVCEIVEGIE